METKIVKNDNGSVHVLGGPLTTAITNQEMPELLLSDVDSRLVKVRPMATPIDQISRLAPSRKCDSMVVEFYTADSQPDCASLTAAVVENSESDISSVDVDKADIFSVSDTLMSLSATSLEDDSPVVFYVEETAPKLKLRALNYEGGFPGLERGSKLVRMARAGRSLTCRRLRPRCSRRRKTIIARYSRPRSSTLYCSALRQRRLALRSATRRRWR